MISDRGVKDGKFIRKNMIPALADTLKSNLEKYSFICSKENCSRQTDCLFNYRSNNVKFLTILYNFTLFTLFNVLYVLFNAKTSGKRPSARHDIT